MDACKKTHTHDDVEPTSYTGWHHWAGRMHRTHYQRKCPHCGLYKVWVPRG